MPAPLLRRLIIHHLTPALTRSIVFLFPLFTLAQNPGIHFEQSGDWSSIQATAKADDRTRSWYADAHAIAIRYGVHSYPTYLIFSPDGKIVHRLGGSRDTAATFIRQVSQTFDSSKAYYSLLAQFEKGRHDSAFLHHLTSEAFFTGDEDHIRAISDAYFATQPNLLTRPNIALLTACIQSSHDKHFQLLVDHIADIDHLFRPGMAEDKIKKILLREYITPATNAPNATNARNRRSNAGNPSSNARPPSQTPPSPNWPAIQRSIAARYPSQAGMIVLRGKAAYYETLEDWPPFRIAVTAYLGKYPAYVTDSELDNFTSTMLEKCSDSTGLHAALDWSRQLVDRNPFSTHLNTYANLLYKLGKKEEAIAWEQKAIDDAGKERKKAFELTLGKMKTGQKL